MDENHITIQGIKIPKQKREFFHYQEMIFYWYTYHLYIKNVDDDFYVL